MALVIRPYTPADLDTWRALLTAPDIAHQFDIYQGDAGFASLVGDPHLDHESIRLAFVGGVPVGFAFAFVIGHGSDAWAMMRPAVLAAHRRHGIGRALAEQVIAHLVNRRAVKEIASSTWVPEPGTHELAAALGFREDRTFWMMTRPRGFVPPEPAWPAGIDVHPSDGSERCLLGWHEAYNDSFAQHYHFVPATFDETRQMAAAEGFRHDGLLLAWRGARCVGFARNTVHLDRGEISVLGTTHDARGIGLGRALLRAGVAWIEANTTLPVTLLVDGENENALGLYRQEGFEITHTRKVWVRPVVRA